MFILCRLAVLVSHVNQMVPHLPEREPPGILFNCPTVNPFRSPAESLPAQFLDENGEAKLQSVRGFHSCQQGEPLIKMQIWKQSD